MTDQNKAPDAAAAKPAGVDNLDKLLEEEQQRQQQDDALVEEIGADESAQINARQERMQREKSSQAGAAMAIGFVSQILVMVDKDAALQAEEKEVLEGALAPVLMKNNAEPPAWMAEYREEFNFFMVGMGVGVGVYMRWRAAKAQPPAAPATSDAGATA